MDDESMPRFTRWDHKGTSEWVQYDFPKPKAVRAISVYWFDDNGHGECRIPQSWRLLYKDGDTFKPGAGASGYGAERDRYNTVTFTSVMTQALRIEAQLQDGFSGGILEWKINRNAAPSPVA